MPDLSARTQNLTLKNDVAKMGARIEDEDGHDNTDMFWIEAFNSQSRGQTQPTKPIRHESHEAIMLVAWIKMQ